MGILENATPILLICTRDRNRARAFYRDTLGLQMVAEDNYAAIFDLGGIALRLATVADFVPHEHTILGFQVADVAVTVRALGRKGVKFNRYQRLKQDKLGILIVPGTATRVAWFKDPDGNVLSVTNG